MASCSSHGAWQYQPASNFIRRFYGCPLLDAAYVSQHRHARLNASGGSLTLPRFSSCSSPPRFDAQRFLDRLAGRTLALVGDSLAGRRVFYVLLRGVGQQRCLVGSGNVLLLAEQSLEILMYFYLTNHSQI